MPRLLLVALLVASCVVSPSTTTASPITTSSTSSSAPLASPCVSGPDAFVADGPVSNLPQPESDASSVAALTWQEFPDCDQVIVEFATADGAPSIDPPTASSEFIRRVSVLRVRFGPEVTATALSDQLIDSALTERAYVVRGLDGQFFIDLHLAHTAEARMTTQSSPGRLIVDLRSGGDPYPATPAVADLTVVVEPVPGLVSYPLTISGYSRHFEANVIARLRADGNPETQAVTTATDWTETWGEFTFDIPTGPEGRVELFVGQESPRDGSEEGIYLALEAGGAA